MLISYKDWITGKRHFHGKSKQVQNDILDDDGIPDTIERDEMIAYLRK